MEEEKCEVCGLPEDECTCEMSTEDLAESNHVMLNALIELLIKKGIFTEEEFDKKLEEFEEEDEDEGSEESEVLPEQ